MREKYKKIITLSSIVVLTCGIINNVIAIIYSFVGINKYGKGSSLHLGSYYAMYCVLGLVHAVVMLAQ